METGEIHPDARGWRRKDGSGKADIYSLASRTEIYNIFRERGPKKGALADSTQLERRPLLARSTFYKGQREIETVDLQGSVPYKLLSKCLYPKASAVSL